MKAMILAAGLGTRLRPLTESIPKALVVVEEKTLLEHALDHLITYGIRQVVINLHHFPEQIRSFMEQHDNFGLEVSYSDESEELLETGGGVLKAERLLAGDGPFLVRNADIISDLDLRKLIDFHTANNALATLAVRNRETSRYLLFDEANRLSGWENRAEGKQRITRDVAQYLPLAFSGIQVIDPAIFPRITERGKFSLIDLYLRLSEHQLIMGFEENSSCWRDAGKPPRK